LSFVLDGISDLTEVHLVGSCNELEVTFLTRKASSVFGSVQKVYDSCSISMLKHGDICRFTGIIFPLEFFNVQPEIDILLSGSQKNKILLRSTPKSLEQFEISYNLKSQLSTTQMTLDICSLLPPISSTVGSADLIFLPI